MDQCKLLYKNKSSPADAAIPCLPGNSIVTAMLANRLSKFSQVNVTVVIPECNSFVLKCEYEWLKKDSEEHGYHVVEAKKQPGFDDPLDWLMFPPEGFKADIVVGMGKKAGKIVQRWKKHYQCKNIYIEDLWSEICGWPVQPKFNSKYSQSERLEIIKEADFAVATGPKLCDELSRDLSYSKPVFNLTPGIISHFHDVSHGDVNTPERKFHVLCLGSDDPNRFEEEGFDIAAKALAQNGKSYRLTYVGSVTNKSQLAEKFRHCGVAETQLDFQSLPRGMEDWKRLLSRADLAIMPSGLNAFGLEALFALSAGLPILVHAWSGFGEALKEVKHGTSAIVDSDDAADWAKEIRKVRETDKKTRLEQATELRANYDETYNWEKQCEELVKMMVNMVSGMKLIPFFFFSFIDLFISAGSEIQY